MRMLAFAFALPLLFVALVLPAAAQTVKQVEVVNLPEVQSVEVTNLPEVQAVGVTNLPAVQDVFVTNPSAPAPPARFQLVGFTFQDYDGDLGGVFGATQKCQLDFADSRMCTTLEVLDTVKIPVALAGEAWVRLIAASSGRDISGVNVGSSHCALWTSLTTQGGNLSGLAVTVEGELVVRDCALRSSIACCAPVP